MFSKDVVFSKQNLGVFVTAVAVGFGLLIGVAGPGRAQDKQAAPPGPQPKDTQEYEMAKATVEEKDPTKKLADADKWKQSYPATELLQARNTAFLEAYTGLKATMSRQAFDMAHEILKSTPDNLEALTDSIQVVTTIKPAPTPQDLDTGEKDALRLLDDASLFAADKKPAGMTDAVWAQTQAQIKAYCEKVLEAIIQLRKDDKRAVDDLTRLIKRDPTLAAASYDLGSAMNRILRAANKPEDLPAALWQFARSISVTGPNALPPANKTSALDFLTKAYTAFHGSAGGLQELIAQTKDSPFPPAGFSIKSTVDIANDQEAKRQEDMKKDPLMFLWTKTLKTEGLLGPNSDALWSSLEGAELPGPDPDDKSDKPAPRFFKCKIVSITPNPKPKEITCGIEKGDVADAKLVFEKPLEGKMEPGDEIQFKGVAKSWTKDPYMITFALDDVKEDLNGTWTGKNPPPARGGGTKGKQSTKAAPKQ